MQGDRSKLVSILIQKGGGSLLRGWRRELDLEGDLEISFLDFCKNAGRMRLALNVERLLSSDQNADSLTLEEVSEHEGCLMSRFRKWVKTTFDNPVAMFEAFDKEATGRLSRAGFKSGCTAHGFEAEAADFNSLYDCIDFEDRGYARPQDTIFLETEAQAREKQLFAYKMGCRAQQQRLLASVILDFGHESVPPQSRLANRPWQVAGLERMPVLVCMKRYRHRVQARINATKAKDKFLRHLSDQWGSSVRAWRRALDANEKFFFSMPDLKHYLRSTQQDIDSKLLWSALDRDTDGRVTIEELSEGYALQLAKFRSWAVKNFGSTSAMWNLPELAGSRQVSITEHGFVSNKKMLSASFIAAIKELGWNARAEQATLESSLAVIADGLDYYRCGLVTQRDLSWLDKWDPPEWLVEEPSEQAATELKRLMLQKYGSLLRAWRLLLDTDSTNEVCWMEFVLACKAIRFCGNVGGAWRWFDQDAGGSISLKEFDPKTADLLTSFKVWAERWNGSVENLFKSVDADGSGTISLTELRRVCNRLQWEGDVRDLFDTISLAVSQDGTKMREIRLQDVVFLDNWCATNSDDADAEMCAGIAEALDVSVSKVLPTLSSRQSKRSTTVTDTATDRALAAECMESDNSFSSDTLKMHRPSLKSPSRRRCATPAGPAETMASKRACSASSLRVRSSQGFRGSPPLFNSEESSYSQTTTFEKSRPSSTGTRVRLGSRLSDQLAKCQAKGQHGELLRTYKFHEPPSSRDARARDPRWLEWWRQIDS